MEKWLKTIYLIQLIHVMDVHSHVNFILIRKLNVGIVDVWENVLHHVLMDVRHHVMEDV